MRCSCHSTPTQTADALQAVAAAGGDPLTLLMAMQQQQQNMAAGASAAAACPGPAISPGLDATRAEPMQILSNASDISRSVLITNHLCALCVILQSLAL